jgi:2-hydroxychromene-2-carboxylate isomerase
LSDANEITCGLNEAGLDAQVWLDQADTGEVKEKLKLNTEAAVKRGLFGAPTMFVGNEMFFGQGRLDFVEEEVKK